MSVSRAGRRDRSILSALPFRLLVLLALVVGGTGALSVHPVPAAAAVCDNPQSIACENSKPGNPSSEWEQTTSAPSTIEGYTTSMSVNVGQTVQFKINTAATGYTMDIYRMGYYQGLGARKIASISPSVSLPQQQPSCLSDATTGLIDCGNWAVSASWAVPSTAVSGVYFAHIKRSDQGSTPDDNHIVFVVRNDASTSDMVFKTSDATWQAYNKWGGNDFYAGDSAVAPGRAVKLSYNRPFTTRSDSPWGRDFVFANEYPMIRFMESNGYDVSYISDIDADRSGALIKNHKVFLSVGHDEYWSGTERTNVEAARDAGVNMSFFSGNEVYWKTRWENSTDGSNTAYRTLVTYKETWANAKIDPTSTWTGTWRDPRFSPPSDGGRPENSLTGTLFTVNCCGTALQVPAADGKMRFWRNTSVANQASGATATLADQTVGYEWDEDPDNGSRPAGAFEMSTTTAGPSVVTAKLTDWGSIKTAPGTATHHLMMYRAASGALVFGAGTVQWSWGLDPVHDGSPTSNVNRGNAPAAADPSMRQATVNLFADMGVQPATLQSDLAPAQGSRDTTPPVSVVTSPASGANLTNGQSITISGTATDVGGAVAGVEVSTDGGTTWHPATGRDTWSYKWDVTGNGSTTIKTRAVDDSGNIETPSAGTSISVSCPCGLFGNSVVPTTADSGDATSLEAGVKFQSAVSGWVTGVRFYKSAANTGTHTGSIWDTAGNQVATGAFSGETASGWQTLTFATPVQIAANTTYVASYYAPNGHYSGDGAYFSYKPLTTVPLTAPQATTTVGNGVYLSGRSGFPTATYNGANYYVDPVFNTVKPPDTIPPVVVSAAPYPGSSSVSTAANPAVTFSETVQSGVGTFTLQNGSTSVSGSVGLDSTRTILTFTPTANLPNGTTFTAAVSGVKDDAGNTMAPYTFTFTTAKAAPAAGSCPCSIWTDATTPAVEGANDPHEIELGVKFTPDTSGFIKGIRFYKGRNNTGTHIGTLWSSSGTQLASATFSGESTLGWQEVTFASPVAVTAGTTYVASYHTTTGWYSATYNGFANGVDTPPLHALANSSGGNGVYLYGARAFPTQSYGATNYWVDVDYSFPPDTDSPVVSGATPSDRATSVPVGSPVKITFGERIQPGTPVVTLKDANGTTVAGSSALDGTGTVLTFTPSSALTAATSYTASVSGAMDPEGNTMSGTVSWSFTTSGACPCTIFESDAAPITAAANDSGSAELGVKFTADSNGWISGVRFYKGSGNTGTHTGSLWDAGGTQLATGTFSGESASGWQSLTFPSPVQITAGTTYVVSYHAPNGHYAADGGYFNSAADNAPLHGLSNGAPGGNGVYRYSSGTSFPSGTHGAANYWVDPIFSITQPGDTVPPTVISANPANGTTSVPPSVTPAVTFSKAVQGGTVQLTLTGPGGVAIAGTVAYNSGTKTATFTPSSALSWTTGYTATLQSVTDLSGNVLTAPYTWSFTTAKQTTAGSCPCSIWPDQAVPQTVTVNDSSSVELGLKFRADSSGWVTGVRFYKGSLNSGTHVGRLWSSSGTLLAQATFTNESAAGWQEVHFSTPVAVTANTTYVVSYFAPNGEYSADSGALSGAGVDAPPLHALQSGIDGPNGVYLYGSGGFPTRGSTSNYWVDTIFTTTHP